MEQVWRGIQIQTESGKNKYKVDDAYKGEYEGEDAEEGLCNKQEQSHIYL